MMSPNARSVFVVESNEAYQGQLGQALRAMQFEVHSFFNAESFLEEHGSDTLGCVIAGLRLGGMSGLELLARLKQQGSTLPLIFVSDRASTQMIVRAMREGAVSFLDTPSNEDDLWLAVREAIAENSRRISRAEKKSKLNARFGHLSDGERHVLLKVCEGSTNKEIASSLDVSIRTVESRRRRLLQKTQSRSFPELLMSYQQFKSTCCPQQDVEPNHHLYHRPESVVESTNDAR